VLLLVGFAAALRLSELVALKVDRWSLIPRVWCSQFDARGHFESEADRGSAIIANPFPRQQFNQTGDRRSDKPSRGVACLDCHANGNTNGAFHLVGDIRPQEFRHRIETTSLRGVNIQRLFGSQRALKTVEDFTEFQQRAAHFDGDPVIATKPPSA
jgi:cytochrome c peroxidase